MPATSTYSTDSVRQYLGEISQYELLTHEESIDLAKRYRQGVLAEERQSRLIEQGMSKLCVDQLIDAGEVAKEELVNRNLRLVVSVAKSVKAPNVDLLSAISEGNAGLIRAVEKFDHTKGYRFSTYASWWIRQGIQRGNSNMDHRVGRLPTATYDLVGKIKRVRGDYTSQFNEAITDSDLAQELGISLEKLHEVERATQYPHSLNKPIAADSPDKELGDLLPDNNDNVAELIDAIDTHELTTVLLQSGLDEKAIEIIYRRYGFHNQERETLQEIGDSLGVSRERIRQIESQTLRHMRQYIKRHRLEWHLS